MQHHQINRKDQPCNTTCISSNLWQLSGVILALSWKTACLKHQAHVWRSTSSEVPSSRWFGGARRHTYEMGRAGSLDL